VLSVSVVKGGTKTNHRDTENTDGGTEIPVLSAQFLLIRFVIYSSLARL
jgi:hypothetical protein